MKYANGKDVLPPELLKEVQKYLNGEMLYIPKAEDNHAAWGELSGFREQVVRRNHSILASYRQGVSVPELIEKFCLSEASIRKIIYTNK